MEKERNLNYWTIRKFSLLYSYYTIIDTTDYLADQLFVKNEVRVWFGQEYICPDGPYIPHAGYVDCGFDSTTLLHSGKYIKYPKHSHCQRWMKRLTSKKTRRCTDLVRKGNEYRRLFDYWWTLY